MITTLTFEQGILVIVADGPLSDGELPTLVEAVRSLPEGSDAIVDLSLCTAVDMHHAAQLRAAFAERRNHHVMLGVVARDHGTVQVLRHAGVDAVAPVRPSRAAAAAGIPSLLESA